MRLVIAFDSSTDHLAVGVARLADDDTKPQMLAAVDFPARRAALGALLPTVRELLADHELALADVAVVAAGRGPGSFTGVRIGVASAKGLAHGLGIPLTGLSTLDAAGWRFCEHTGLVGVVGDAMRGEVYPGLLRCGKGRCERLDTDRVSRPRAAAEAWAAQLTEPVMLTGNGLAKYAEMFAELLGERATIADESLWTPTGVSLIDAAWAESGPVSLRTLASLTREQGYALAGPGALLPVYTRLSDAEEAERDRARVAADNAAVPSSGVSGPLGGER